MTMQNNIVKNSTLILASLFILFIGLGARDLWTQEWRWADIVWRMQYAHNYFHPMLAGQAYYDKPLLSYWLILLSSYGLGELSEVSLRLPSVLGGLVVLLSTFRLSTHFFNKNAAYVATWLLLTTYFFLFWAKVASSDMLNVAGSMLAIDWYYAHKTTYRWTDYCVFFIILAVTALIKGLIGSALPLLVVFTDLTVTRQWRRLFSWSLWLSLLPAVGIYFIPFILSSSGTYQENGLYLVYRENILRFFAPFDHQDPWYIYFYYLPLYLLPWTFLAIPFFLHLPKRWPHFNLETRGFFISIGVLFLFFILSGSRRSYYILPLVPLCIISLGDELSTWSSSHRQIMAKIIGIFYGFYILFFGLFIPYYYKQYGLKPFVEAIKQAATQYAPWPAWNVTTIGADDRVAFYLHPTTPSLSLSHFPTDPKQLIHPYQILIIRKTQLPLIQPYLTRAKLVTAQSSGGASMVAILWGFG